MSAARYRAAREAFELAMKLGCTPRDAMRELRRRRAACGRVDMAAASPAQDETGAMPAPDFRDWNNPWMMRE